MKRLITIFAVMFLLTSCAATTPAPDNAFNGAVYDRTIIENSVVYIASSTDHSQHGSGVVVEPRVIITAKHVAEAILSSGARIQVRTKSGKVITSRIAAAMSESIDVAVLFLIEDVPVTPIPLTCRRAVVGEKIFSVGHPLNEEWIYTFGYISRSEADPLYRHQATTMPVANGLSGAPVWNSLGQFVGLVNSFMALSLPKQGQTEKAGKIRFLDSMKAGFSLIIPADAVCAVYDAAKRAKIKYDAKK